MRFKDKVVVITGSGRGIGRATAELFAAEGAWVVVNGRTQSEIDAVVASIETRGGKALAVQADVGEPDVAERLMISAEQGFGRIDILVNNAAIFRSHDFVQDDWADWMRVVARGRQRGG
jgi:NAD(P)-dependent dehydrogenase (short-subunit alcohol dehydrogenase family)